MRIVLSGVETNNKGAELMLYAILQEIEQQYPNAIVYAPTNPNMTTDLSSIKTSLDFRIHPSLRNKKLLKQFHLLNLSKKLHIFEKLYNENNYKKNIIKNIDYFIDASGFHFSDQWNYPQNMVNYWSDVLEWYHRQGTKIIFLPQAFGPANQQNTKKALDIVSKYASKIFARDSISYSYLKEAGIEMNNVELFPDFTNLVKGVIPQKYNHLRNGICIIPNMRMIDRGRFSLEKYLDYLSSVIEVVQLSNHSVFLLNHEGIGDEEIILKCKERFKDNIESVIRLNALEIKGLIANSYLCISSRFHGVVSALNSGVPCLSTSWSHKYQELYKDYNQHDCILSVENLETDIKRIKHLIEPNNNKAIRMILNKYAKQNISKTQEMWKLIWSENILYS